MNAFRTQPVVDVQLGTVLLEDFGLVQSKQPAEQADWLALLPSDADAETIRARCVMAYRRELSLCLAEHFAKQVSGITS